jgi:hypothetical protein
MKMLKKTKSVPNTVESFVAPDQVARFLSLTRRRVLNLARAGHLPGYPIGGGARRVWRFRLSEIAAAIAAWENSGSPKNIEEERDAQSLGGGRRP